jgi:hypothetical protein
MRSGIAVVGFLAGHYVPERASASFPNALAQQSVEKLSCFVRLEKSAGRSKSQRRESGSSPSQET